MPIPNGKPAIQQQHLLLLELGSSLFLATFLIATDLLLPWSALLVVLAYGGVIFLQIRNETIPPTEHINDSPYFLGFLLTLISLFFSFLKLGQVEPLEAMGYTFRAIGAAISTTIVGLTWRVILNVTNPIEQKVEELIYLLQEEFRVNAGRFKDAQLELIRLVTDYTDAQKIILSTQEEVSEKYIHSLKQTAKTLSLVGTQTVSQFEKHADSLARLAQKFDGSGEELLKTIEATKAATQGLDRVNRASREFQQKLEEVTLKAGELQTVLTSLHLKSQTAQQDLQAVDFLLSEFIQIARQRIEGLTRIR